MMKTMMKTRVVLTFATMLLSGCGAEGRASGPTGRVDPLAGAGSATHPAISPDGTALAFMSNVQGVETGLPINFEIYILDLDALRIRRVTHDDAFDADIAWSPDGRRIAFKSYRDGNDEIYVVDVSGEATSPRNLTMHPGSDFQPHFSPDGAQLAFASNRGGSAGLYRLELGSGTVTTLLDTEASESSPRFSPDGARIAFVSGADGDDDIFVMEADGTKVRRVAGSQASDWSPRWSPDGSTLLYIEGSFETDEWDLRSVRVDAPGASQLVVAGVDSGNAAWHPSGERIYFGRYVDGESRLFSARPDGSDVQPVLAAPNRAR